MNAVPAEINNSLINNSVEQDTEISSSPKQKGSFTVSSPIGTTEAVPNQVVDTAISPTCLESSKFNLSKKEERCKRLDNLISKMRKEKSAIVQSKVVTSQPPLNSALESNSMTRDRQVQTSLNKSNEASQKLDPSKKTCARKIFTNTIAEGETNSQLDLNSHNSSSSGMTDMSKALEEYDEGILDDSEGMARVPWRYEEWKLLKKKHSDTDFDSSSSDLENSGNKIDCVSKNRRKSVPRSRSTFRYYRKKGSAKDTRNIENNRAPSSARGSDDGEENIQGTIDYPKRLSLGKNLQEKPQKEAVQNDVEPEENTLIDDTENRNTCNNLIVFQSNKLSHQLFVVLRRLSKKTFEVKRNKNIKTDSEGGDDASAKSTKNSFSQMKHFKSFSDLVVPLNQTEMVAVQDTPVTVNYLENIADEAHTESQPQNTPNNKRTGNKKTVEANANEAHTESQSKNAPNNERTGNKKTEPVFKVSETKPRKTARKRIFPKNNSNDICIESECPPSTGSRKSARDRKPPTIKYFIQEVYEIHEKPQSVKSRGESAKKHKLENDKEKKESTTKRRGTSKNSSLAVKDNIGNDEDQGKCTTKKRGGSKSSTPAVNGIENDQDRRTSTAKKRSRPKSKTSITVSEPSSEQNEDGSTTGPETTGKRTKMDKHIESNSSEIDTVSQNHDINTSSSQDNPNRFEYGNEDQELDNDMFLRIPDPRNMVSQDSGTSTLLRSNTFDNSNLLSTKRSRKNDGSKENKISKVLSEPGSVSPIKGDISMSKDRRMTRNSLVQNDSVDIQSGSEIVRLKYVEREPQFKTCQDDLLLTSFIRNINGTTTGYLKVPAGKMKPVHKTKKHSLCFFVLEGEGNIEVHDKTSEIQKMSCFLVPLGVEYAIMNDGPDEMLLACVKVEGT